MKSVHKALHLRHKKYTGKLLAHKHTSYRVLFLLMLVPVIMLALVGHIVNASDFIVTATVPAPMPAGNPVIILPTNGTTTKSGSVTVSGTCPTSNPAIIITIYDGPSLVGSVQCTVNGTFSVPVSLTVGTHSLVATIVTITGQTGTSSQPVTVTRNKSTQPTPSPITIPTSTTGSGTTDTSPTLGSVDLIIPPIYIAAKDKFVLIGSDGSGTWHGSFSGGTDPYTVRIDWGDGNVDTHNVTDQADQTFTHHYASVATYTIIVRATDKTGDSSALYSTALTLSSSLGAGTGVGAGLATDNNFQQQSPIVTFIQEHMWQIYIASLSGLTFLWYLEHGRHIVGAVKVAGKGPGGLHWHR